MSVQGSDNFADAPLLPIGVASAATPSAGLTVETGEPDTTSRDRSAWWRIVPDTTGPLLIETGNSVAPSGGDNWLSVFTGTSLGDLVEVAYDDDSSALQEWMARVVLHAEAGVTYYVRVSLYSSSADMSYVVEASPLHAGPWRNDADTGSTSKTAAVEGDDFYEWTSQALATGSGDIPGTLIPQVLNEAWAGTNGPNLNHPSPGAGEIFTEYDYSEISGNSTASAFWRVSWGTIDTAPPSSSDGWVNNSMLPADVWDSSTGTFIDRNVVGVEWGTPEGVGDATVQVRLTSGDYDGTADQTWHVVIEHLASGSAVDFHNRAALAVLPQALTITPGDVATIPASFPWLSMEGATSAVDLFTEGRVAFALVDSDTLTGTTDASVWAAHLNADRYTVFQNYRVPYRLLYAAPQATEPRHLRVFPRADGRGLSGGRRMFPPPPTRQASIRRGPGSFY